MSGKLQATDVTYMRLSGDRGWQKHAKLHSVAFTAASHDSAVLTVAEGETQRQRECLSLPRDIVQASLNGSSTLRLTARGTPLRKIALTFSSAGELDLFAKRIHAITRVRGIEQLPGPSLTAEAAMAAQTEPLPDLSAPVVQAYAARLLFDDRFHEFVCQLGEFFCGLTARLPASTASAAAAASGPGFAVAQESGQKRKRGADSEAVDDDDAHEHNTAAAAAATAVAGCAVDSTAAASGFTAGQRSAHSESVLQPRSLMNSATPSSAAQASSSTAAYGRATAPASVTPAAGYMPVAHSLQQQQQQQQQQQLVNHHRAAAAAVVTPAPEAELTPPDAVRSSVRGGLQSSVFNANSAAGSAAVTRVHSPRAVYPQQQQQLAEAQRQQARMQHAAQQHQQQQQRQYQHQLQLQHQQQQSQRQLQQQQFMRPQSVSEAQQAQRHTAPQPAVRRAAVPAAAAAAAAATAAAATDDSSSTAAPAAKRKRGRPATKNAAAAAADSQASVVSVAAAVPSVRKSVAERFSAAVVGGKTPRGERAALYAELKSLWEAVYVLEDCWPFRKPVKPSTPGYKVSL
jgi:hypothetical protein